MSDDLPIADRELPWHTEALRRELAALDRMPHALLLRGASGIGKGRYARALAAALLCEAPGPDRRACGRCPACGWVDAETHPDLRRLELRVDDEGKPEREIKVDQARALGEFLTVGAHRGGRRVVVIDPADAMNTVTSNFLLKTLEEPGEGFVFLLVTARPDAVSATIRSRCQARTLPSPSHEAARAWLVARTGAPPADAEAWLATAGGAPLTALRLAEPGQAAAHRAMLEAIARLPDTPPVALAEAFDRIHAREWLPLAQRWIADVGRCLAGAPPRYFPAHAARLAELAARTDAGALSRAAAALATQARDVEHPLNARLACETALDACAAAFGAPRPRTGARSTG